MPKKPHAQRKLFWNNPEMDYGSSKSAKIILSKSIFYFKNQRNFFIKKSFKNINLGDHFLEKPFFFSNFNFWTNSFSKIMPWLFDDWTPRILKIQWFPFSILIFGQKPCLGPTIFKIPQPILLCTMGPKSCCHSKHS